MRLTSPDILTRLVRRFGLLVLLTLIGASAGGIYGAVKTPTYVAQAYVVVTGEPGESVAALNFAQAFGRIATKGPVAERAAAVLGSTEELKRVTASTSPDAPVIEITATGRTAGRTATVANAVAQALVEVGTARRDQTRVGLAVLASASTPTGPSSPKPPLELAVGAAGGLLIGALAVLAGVGRPARRPEVAPTRFVPAPLGTSRYEVADFDPDAAPALTAYLNPPQDSPPDAAEPDGATAAADRAPNGQRIVGRAVVIYRDEP
jgi:uncharacterized protein involved in exopolysaccharide biosynthesis